MSIVSVRYYHFPRSLKTNGPFPKISKTPGMLGPQGEEAVINVVYFKIKYTMGVERRNKGCALFHIIFLSLSVAKIHVISYVYCLNFSVMSP